MRKVLTFLLIVFSGVIVWMGMVLYLFLFNSTPNLIVAKTVPRYPNVVSSRVGSSSGFLDSFPSSSIYFTTGDTAESVIDYYVMQLPQEGWTLLEDYHDPLVTYRNFEKMIGGRKYTLNLNINQSIYTQSPSTSGNILVQYEAN